jgi:hypothetical protein
MAMTQRDAILEYLQMANAITPIEALMKFGCFRLGARIHELRGQGHEIKTEWTTDGAGKTYARYRYHHPTSGEQQQLPGT